MIDPIVELVVMANLPLTVTFNEKRMGLKSRFAAHGLEILSMVQIRPRKPLLLSRVTDTVYWRETNHNRKSCRYSPDKFVTVSALV